MTAALNEQIAVLDAQIGRLFAAHPNWHIFASLPRSGTVRAATVLAEIGDCRQRFPTDDAWPRWPGRAPRRGYPASAPRRVFRWSCSKKLRAAVTDFANGSRMADPGLPASMPRPAAAYARHPDPGPCLAADHLGAAVKTAPPSIPPLPRGRQPGRGWT